MYNKRERVKNMKEDQKKLLLRVIAFIIIIAFAATGVGVIGVSIFGR